MLDCLHTFCKGCIERWLQTNSTCPSCRTHVRKTEPHRTLKALVDAIQSNRSSGRRHGNGRARQDYRTRPRSRLSDSESSRIAPSRSVRRASRATTTSSESIPASRAGGIATPTSPPTDDRDRLAHNLSMLMIEVEEEIQKILRSEDILARSLDLDLDPLPGPTMQELVMEVELQQRLCGMAEPRRRGRRVEEPDMDWMSAASLLPRGFRPPQMICSVCMVSSAPCPSRGRVPARPAHVYGRRHHAFAHFE